MKEKTTRLCIIATIVFIIVAGAFGYCWSLLKAVEYINRNTQTKTNEIIAMTWSWSKIVSTPVPIVTTNKSDDLRLMQVGFKVGDGSINTALMVSSELLNMKSSPIPKWKVGDEILIASVPGSIINNVPSPSYIVIDYRSQKPEIPYPR